MRGSAADVVESGLSGQKLLWQLLVNVEGGSSLQRWHAGGDRMAVGIGCEVDNTALIVIMIIIGMLNPTPLRE